MPKIPKNSIIVIALSIISLILGGTFFVISQNKSGQTVALNPDNSVSSTSQIPLHWQVLQTQVPLKKGCRKVRWVFPLYPEPPTTLNQKF